MKEFPERLKMLKGDMNVSQFARFLGVKQQTLNNYLKGRVPTLASVVVICNKCCVSADWLIGLVEKKERDVVQPSVVNNESSKSPYLCVECAKKDNVIKTLAESNRMLIDNMGKSLCQRDTPNGGEASRKGE